MVGICEPFATQYDSFAAALAALRTGDTCPEQEVQARYQKLLNQLNTTVQSLGGIHMNDPNGIHHLLNSLVSLCPSDDWRLATNCAAINQLVLLVHQLVLKIRAEADNIHAMVQADLKYQRSTLGR
jgi:hypothetical protein